MKKNLAQESMGNTIGGAAGGFMVDLDRIPMVKGEICSEQVKMEAILDQIDSVAANTLKAWEHSFTTEAAKDMKAYIQRVREKQEVLGTNIQQHLDVIIERTQETEKLIQTNAALFHN